MVQSVTRQIEQASRIARLSPVRHRSPLLANLERSFASVAIGTNHNARPWERGISSHQRATGSSAIRPTGMHFNEAEGPLTAAPDLLTPIPLWVLLHSSAHRQDTRQTSDQLRSLGLLPTSHATNRLLVAAIQARINHSYGRDRTGRSIQPEQSSRVPRNAREHGTTHLHAQIARAAVESRSRRAVGVVVTMNGEQDDEFNMESNT